LPLSRALLRPAPPRAAPLLPRRARRLKLHAGTKAERLEPAIITNGTGPSALYVKILSTGELRYTGVTEADVVPLPKRAFRTGDWVRRAMWSGEEEDAEVRAAAAADAMHCRVARQCHDNLVCRAARANHRAALPAHLASHALARC
jgi:hypothetical protein